MANARPQTAIALAGEPYQTSDGRWLLLAVTDEDLSWPIFARAVGREDLLADRRFVDARRRSANARSLIAELDRAFLARPLAHWKQALDAVDLPYGVVQFTEMSDRRAA